MTSADIAPKDATYKMGPKGQVVIPKRIRDRLHLEPGDRLLVREEKDEVHIRKAALDPAERRAIAAGLLGILRESKRDVLAELESEHRREVEEDDREMRERGL